MTAMTIMYTRRTGHPLAAMVTTVAGEPPSLDPASTVQASVPIPEPPPPPPPGGTPLVVPAAPAAPATPPEPVPRPLVLGSQDVRIAVFDTEFDDPLRVFDWRVVRTTGPDGREQRQLDRPSSGQVTAVRTGAKLTLTVPRLGNEVQLDYDVYTETGLLASGHVDFAPTDPASKPVTVDVPDAGRPVVLVKGYPAAISTEAAPIIPSPPGPT